MGPCGLLYGGDSLVRGSACHLPLLPAITTERKHFPSHEGIPLLPALPLDVQSSCQGPLGELMLNANV